MDDRPVVFIEYLPAEHAWRPVNAPGYMLIHCMYLYSNKDKGKGHASRMVKAADLGINLIVKKITNSEEARRGPSGFGVFSLMYNGKLLADHYISSTRFKNIVKKELNL